MTEDILKALLVIILIALAIAQTPADIGETAPPDGYFQCVYIDDICNVVWVPRLPASPEVEAHVPRPHIDGIQHKVWFSQGSLQERHFVSFTAWVMQDLLVDLNDDNGWNTIHVCTETPAGHTRITLQDSLDHFFTMASNDLVWARMLDNGLQRVWAYVDTHGSKHVGCDVVKAGGTPNPIEYIEFVTP